jgi:hypothetical protein
MQRIRPIVARLRAKLLGNSSFSACASETIELAPAVDRWQPPAIALPGEFDRVLGIAPHTTIAMERERLSGGQRRYGPTIAYRIDGAVLADGTLYSDGGYQVIRGRASNPILHRDRDHFAEMQLCTDYFIDRYFGHWLTEGLVLELLAEQRSVPGLTLAGDPWLHEPGYRELSDLKIRRSRHAFVERLWMINDYAVNDGWASRMHELRRRVRRIPVRDGPKRVILSRGALGARRNLVNSSEVYEALARVGFEIINPESEVPQSLVEKLSGVELAIAIDGSAHNHCWLAMPARSSFISIQPSMRFTANGKRRADLADINWAYVVADAHPDGFTLPVARLLQTVDEVMRVAGLQV